MAKYFRLTALLLSFYALLFSVNQVQAQNARGMAITPPKFELFANPGDQITEQIRVRNESVAPATYEIVVEDFSSSGEEGQVVLEDNQTNTQYSLAQWIEPEAKDIVLQPNEEKTLSFKINVPRNAEPGGHYASLLFQAGGVGGPGSTSVTQRVGALVLLRVSGNVTEKATIETFEAPKYSKNTPVLLTLRLKNEGNTHINPKGTVVITDMFGKKVDELTLNGQNVLPGTTRKMDTEWKMQNVLGYYTATLVATYGQTNLPLTTATKFLVVNPTAAGLIAVGVIAFILFIVSLIAGRSRLMKALRVIFGGK